MAVGVLGGRGLAATGTISGVPGQTASDIQDIGEISESSETASASPGKFRFNAGVRAQYTSNGRLSGNHGSSDVIWFPTFEAGYNVGLGRGFAFDALLRIESGLYTRNTERTYVGYSLQSTLEWRPKPNLPRIFVGVEPYRYDASDSRDLLTEAIGLSAGTDWGYAFNRGRSLFFIGYTFTNYFSDPYIDTRGTHSALIGISHQLGKNLFSQLYYQYQYVDFENISRRDSRNVVGLSFTWQIDEHLSSTLTGSFVDSDSTQDHASYQSAGASIGLNYRF
jgi:hypothetical protein